MISTPSRTTPGPEAPFQHHNQTQIQVQPRRCLPLHTLLKPVYDDDGAPTLGAVLAAVFEYTSKHRMTQTASKELWELLGALMPDVDTGHSHK